ncbi:hypothetical protein [Dyella flava]|uniref:Uncharacterized protein n=1 Tax=Dyella flava TaxID=1920170 RepID=A0ABS2K2A0_9GAMM|nr:hypothetical protein [Dyella flava]MBM7125029.1 hypothetical protein [Dyella flava]
MAALIRTRESTLRWGVRVDVVMQEVNGGTQAVAFAGVMGGKGRVRPAAFYQQHRRLG